MSWRAFILQAHPDHRGPIVELAIYDPSIHEYSEQEYFYLMHWYFSWKRGERQMFPFQRDGTLHPNYHAGVDTSFTMDVPPVGTFQAQIMLANICKAVPSERGHLIENLIQTPVLRNEFLKLGTQFHHILMWYFAWKRGEDALFPYDHGINMDYYAGINIFQLPRYCKGRTLDASG